MATRQYIGARYTPKFSGTYDNTQAYEALEVVDNGSGTTYIARKPVPPNTPLTDTTYWLVYGSSSGAILDLQDRMGSAEESITTINSSILHMGGEIDTLNNNVNTLNNDVSTIQTILANVVNKTRHFITVGATGCDYDNIETAVTYAKTIASANNRVCIILFPGVYVGSVELAPNPGIDMIGIGLPKIVNTTEVYPKGALYTCGNGYFEGIYFQNNVSTNNTYALHMEHDTADTSGMTIFKDCQFQNVYYHAAGCGMNNGSELYFIGCRFYSGSATAQSAAAYFHNRMLNNANPQTIHCWDCYFHGTNANVRIDDAFAFSGASGTSILNIDFENCIGILGKHVIFGTGHNTVTPTYNNNSNLNITGYCSGNNVALQALNYYTKGTITLVKCVGVTEFGRIVVEIPPEVQTSNLTITLAVFTVDGSNNIQLGTPDETNSANYIWKNFTAYSGKNVQVTMQFVSK